MTKQIFKVVFLGILGGLALFAIPFFLLKAVIFFLLFGFFIRRFAGRRRFGPGFAFAGGGPMKQRFQNMSEEERKAFFTKMKQHGCDFSEKEKATDVTSENK
jgi:hypothetical protein